MSGSVDVLKVLSHHEAALRAKCGTPLNELANARAVVAELINAASAVEYNATRHDGDDRMFDRLHAALARVQGGSA